MEIVSIQVGRPRRVAWRGREVETSIWKTPVAGRVRVREHNLDGDEQSDLTVHGGPDKAVYLYPSEHYAFWRRELPDAELAWGGFGENLTTRGLLEDAACIGDRIRCGTAELAVSQPRSPCFKLGIRFGRPDLVKRFQQSGRTGFYLRVVRPGEIGAGDALELLPASGDRMSIAEIARLMTTADADRDALRRAAALPGLAESWRSEFVSRLGGA